MLLHHQQPLDLHRTAPSRHQRRDIFFLELIAIMSAIHHVASFPSPPHHLLIHSDSLDSVAVFNNLCTSEPLHNGPLMAVAGIIMQSGIDLHV